MDELREGDSLRVDRVGARETTAMREAELEGLSTHGLRGFGRHDRSVALMMWDALLPVLLIIFTMPLAGSLGFRNYGTGEAIGALHPAMLILALLSPVLVGAAGGYESARDRFGGSLALVGRLVLVAALVVWIIWLLAAARGPEADLSQLAFYWLLLPLGWLLPRLADASRVGRRPQRVLLVGSGQTARQVNELVGRQRSRRVEVVGYIDDEPMAPGLEEPRLLGGLDDLGRVLASEHMDRVIVCFSLRNDREMRRVILQADSFGINVDVVPRMFDLLPQDPRGGSLGGMPLVSLRRPAPNVLERGAKRTVDVLGATALLMLLSPILVLVAMAIRLDDGGAILYRSNRVGRRGRQYAMLKYRTLAIGADHNEAQRVQALVAGERKPHRAPNVTRVGAVLRRLSIDELPQLINVLRGEMSLVGPRPILVSEAHGVPTWQRSRHDVRPGMTGLWQVLGRGQLQWEERMHLDYSYARHWSLATDLRIMVRTLPALLSRLGAS